MSPFTLYRRVILPSALRRALPYYSNEVILMLHATTVAFTATVPDILKIARDVNSATYQSFAAFGIAALLYLIISFALVWLFRRAERRWLAYLRPQGNKPREPAAKDPMNSLFPMLFVDNLHKQYGDNEVLKGVTLKAKRGDVISVIGSSGSGKSTMLRCINFLEQPNEGRIFVDGEEVRTLKDRAAHCACRIRNSCSGCAHGSRWCSSISICGRT